MTRLRCGGPGRANVGGLNSDMKAAATEVGRVGQSGSQAASHRMRKSSTGAVLSARQKRRQSGKLACLSLTLNPRQSSFTDARVAALLCQKQDPAKGPGDAAFASWFSPVRCQSCGANRLLSRMTPEHCQRSVAGGDLNMVNMDQQGHRLSGRYHTWNLSWTWQWVCRWLDEAV